MRNLAPRGSVPRAVFCPPYPQLLDTANLTLFTPNRHCGKYKPLRSRIIELGIADYPTLSVGLLTNRKAKLELERPLDRFL